MKSRGTKPSLVPDDKELCLRLVGVGRAGESRRSIVGEARPLRTGVTDNSRGVDSKGWSGRVTDLEGTVAES